MSGIVFEVSKPVKLIAHYLEVDAEVRYWEDATVNGVQDVDGMLIPLKCGESWNPVIELTTGKILGWPQGTRADIHYKVCDQGFYWLLNENSERIAQWKSSYVPRTLLCVGEDGFGDYIILKVGEDGKIIDWRAPEIDGSEWNLVESVA